MPRAAWIVAAALSLVASALHAAVAKQHFNEWWGYGLFFVLAAIAQGLYGLVLLALPRAPAWAPADWRRFRVALLWSGIALNLSTLALYMVTRTIGVPLGPGAGDVEPVGALDLFSKAAEVGTVIVLAFLLRQIDRKPKTVQPGPGP